MIRLPHLDRRLLGISVCLSILLSLGSAGWSVEPPRYLSLTILHTNDVHGHLFPISAYGVDYGDSKVDQLKDVGGMAREATLIRRIRSTSANPVLVMSAGDVFTRGPIADLHGKPEFDIMNAIPYDVMTLGNNEFEGAEGMEGQKILLDRIKQAKFPVLSANVFYKSTGKEITLPYRIFEVKGVKIGVFGLTAPRVQKYSTAVGLEVKDPASVAKEVVAELRKKADFVIALTHVGYNYAPLPCDMMLAMMVPDIDVIIGGDSHTWLREPTVIAPLAGSKGDSGVYVSGAVITQAGEWGVEVGKLDLRLAKAEGHRYRVGSYSEEFLQVGKDYAPAKDVEQIIESYTKPMRKEIGRLPAAISKADTGNWLAQCVRETTGTEIAIVSADAVEDGLPAGAITELDLRRMCPWQDTAVLKTTVTAKQLQAVIAERHPFVAGARITDGALYVGDTKAADAASYTVALGDIYWLGGSAMKDAKTQPTGLTIGEAVVKCLTQSK